MHTPEQIEDIFARLMPVALSTEAQSDIESMIDELAGPAVEGRPSIIWFRRPWIVGSAAAGIALTLVLPFSMRRSAAPATAAAESDSAPGFVLVGESGSIRSISEEGWREDRDGNALRSLRMKVVEENKILDEETGLVMTLTEPRDEYLLMPVSAF